MNDNPLGSSHSLLAHFLTDTGKVRDFVGAVHRRMIVLSGAFIGRSEVGIMFFVNHKIGDGSLYLESGSSGNGSAAYMYLNTDVVNLRHIADLLGFRDTAGVGKIRLNKRQSAVLKKRPEIPAGIAALAGGKRNITLLFNVPVDGSITGHGGLFIIHNSIGLQSITQFNRRVGIQKGMDLNYDIHVRSASFSGCCNTLHCALQITLAEAAAMVCTLGNKGIHACILNRSEDWIDLDSIVTIRYGILYHIVVVFGVIEHGQTVLHLDEGSPAKLQLAAELTYGYVLGEAALRFANGASGGKEGRFEFEKAAEILPATTTGEEPETQTLKFLPADGSDGETKEIPVTVRRRYLPIKISNFEVEYGDDFSRDVLTRDVVVTAGGYLLPEHLARLNEIIQQYEIQWLLRDGEGNEIPWPDTPETDTLASGTIDLKASVGITPETEFPNYNARVERGVWKIVPRTVTVSWRWDNGAWRAELGNILPGDDVAPVLTDGTLTLTGEQAAYYQVADEDQTAPPIPSRDSDRDPSEPSAGHPLRAVEAAHGKVAVSKARVSPGEAVTLSVTPDKGYVLETLVVTDALGKALPLTPLGKGRYSFIMPDSEVTIKAAFLNAADVPVSFADVSADDYYYEAVLWAVSQGITLGTDDAHFSPDADCARGQLVTFLWRAAGKPKAEQAALFSDVGADAYYAEAVRWAAALGIVTGYSDGCFGAGDPITRQQMAVMLYRFARALGMETVQSGADARGFDDFEQVSAYAEEAIAWAANAAILRGADNRLMPQAPCTRAQMVTMLNRLLGE